MQVQRSRLVLPLHILETDVQVCLEKLLSFAKARDSGKSGELEQADSF